MRMPKLASSARMVSLLSLAAGLAVAAAAPANAQQTESIAGRFFTVLGATAKFTVELDGRTRREVRVGSKISDPPTE